MSTVPLHHRDGHVFIELDGRLWLVDTGAPTSFGTDGDLVIGDEAIHLGTNYVGLTAATAAHDVRFEGPTEARWGTIVQIDLPSGSRVGLYQPKHPTALSLWPR